MGKDEDSRPVRSQDFRELDRSGALGDAIKAMDEIYREPFIAALKAESHHLAGAVPGASILDVGCGTGQDLVDLGAMVAPGGRVSGVDLSQGMVDEAARRLAAAGIRGDVRKAEGTSLPLPDASFDGVRAERVLQQVDDPVAVLREMVRVTRPGGRVVAIDPDRGVFAQDFVGWDHDVAFRLGRWAAEHGPQRNGLIGRKVRRHMVSLGLVEVTAHARVNTSTEEIARRPHLIDQFHQQAVAAGVITAGEAGARTAAILKALQEGTFLHTTLFWMTVGTKPRQRSVAVESAP